MPEDIQELKSYLENMRGQCILGQCCADLDVHDMTVLLTMIDKYEKQQQEIERLKEAEFKACSKHHDFIEEIETLEKDINMIKDLAVACDADERAIQPYEILGLLNTR